MLAVVEHLTVCGNDKKKTVKTMIIGVDHRNFVFTFIRKQNYDNLFVHSPTHNLWDEQAIVQSLWNIQKIIRINNQKGD